jgi:AcrR family transcriptional regulator
LHGIGVRFIVWKKMNTEKRSEWMENAAYQRARSQNQIADRIASILEAAGTVFSKVPYEQVTMQMIALEAGFTRSNIYRYFKTREEIFLELYIMDFKKWVESIKNEFTQVMDIDSFLKRWTALLYEQKRYISLTPLLAISLEKKPSLEVFKKTKADLLQSTLDLIPILRATLPFLSFENCLDFAHTHHAVVSGAWPMGHYSTEQKDVLKEIGYDLNSLKFSNVYAKTLRRYLFGIYWENREVLN